MPIPQTGVTQNQSLSGQMKGPQPGVSVTPDGVYAGNAPLAGMFAGNAEDAGNALNTAKTKIGEKMHDLKEKFTGTTDQTSKE